MVKKTEDLSVKEIEELMKELGERIERITASCCVRANRLLNKHGIQCTKVNLEYEPYENKAAPKKKVSKKKSTKKKSKKKVSKK